MQTEINLLDEIECNPDFSPKKVSSDTTVIAQLSYRLSKMYMEHEALLLLLRVKGILTEDEYQKAIHHIVEETKQMDELTEINAEYIKNSDEKFKEMI
jgi:hypothetical protein